MGTITGLAFPFRIAPSGGLETATDAQKIRDNVVAVITTRKGERVMLPDFGIDGAALIFRNASDPDLVLFQHLALEALQVWEPRVDVQEFSHRRDVDKGEVIFHIGYVIVGTGTFDEIDVPFPYSGGV